MNKRRGRIRDSSNDTEIFPTIKLSPLAMISDSAKLTVRTHRLADHSAGELRMGVVISTQVGGEE